MGRVGVRRARSAWPPLQLDTRYFQKKGYRLVFFSTEGVSHFLLCSHYRGEAGFYSLLLRVEPSANFSRETPKLNAALLLPFHRYRWGRRATIQLYFIPSFCLFCTKLFSHTHIHTRTRAPS